MEHYHENLNTFEVNRLPPRAHNIPDDAQLLNGKWDFKLADSVAQALTWNNGTLEDPEKIKVPSHWQLQDPDEYKYGIPQYINIRYPFPVIPPNAPTKNPTGVYQTEFEIKEDKDYRIRFDGVDSAYWVFVNDKFLGFATGSRNPTEFEMKELKNGKNKLSVVVAQWSLGSYIEDQDQWWFSGIFRDVNVIGYDKRGHIEDYAITTESLDQDQNRAQVRVQAWVEKAPGASVELDIDGIGKWSKPCGNGSVTFDIDVQQPRLWSAEDPNLYDVKLSLKKDGDDFHEVKGEHLGIRTSEVKDGKWLVNGKQVQIRGTNRHDDHPRKGRAIDSKDVYHDLILMKQHNINAIRCSHYPSHPSLVYWADRLGFYVIDESDLETHGAGSAILQQSSEEEKLEPKFDTMVGTDFVNVQNGTSTRLHPKFYQTSEGFFSDNEIWQPLYLDRVKRLLYRDRNHACVVMWSLGNESFMGKNHLAMRDWVKKNSKLPVHYEGENSGGSDAMRKAMDVHSEMYPSFEHVISYGEGKEDDGRPMILCEAIHSMGNGPGATDDYMAIFDKYENLQGFLAWEWMNHGLLKKGPNGEYMAYGGDFGELITDGTFILDGLCDSNHEPTPGLVQLKKTYQPVQLQMNKNGENVHIKVHDKSLYTKWNDHYDITAEMHSIPAVGEKSKKLGEVSFDGKDELDVKVEPNSYVTAFVKNKKKTEWAEKGDEVTFEQYVNENSVYTPSNESVKLEKKNGKFVASFGGAEASLDMFTGVLNLEKDGSTVTKTSPSLNFWRAPTDNDLGGYENTDQNTAYNIWKNHYVREMQESVDSVQQQQDNVVKVESWFGPAVVQWGVYVKTQYTFTKENGKLGVKVDFDFKPDGPHPYNVPRLGYDMQLDDDYDTAKWFGRGPGESYADSYSAQRFGVFEKKMKDLEYPYEHPQENGNRMNVSWVEITGKDNNKLQVVAPKDPLGFTLLPYTPLEYERADHPYQLPNETHSNLMLNFGQHGLGSASVGPKPLPHQQLNLTDSSHSLMFLL